MSMSMENNVSETSVHGLISTSFTGNPHNHRRSVKERASRAIITKQRRPGHTTTTMDSGPTTRQDVDSSVKEAESSSPSPRTSPFRNRLCISCEQPIPCERLIARPNANMCVPCLEAAGDVPQLRRLDEHCADGNRTETLFTVTPATSPVAFQRYITRMNHVVAPDKFFEMAVGDDSFLEREGDSVIDIARSLYSEFEDDEPEATPIQLRMAA